MLTVFIILAYTIGSIPTSVWIGKWFYGIDIREHGSGNAGATNTFRVLGAKAAIPVFFFDTFKGFILPFISKSYFSYSDPYFYPIIIGIASVLGHIFPIFAGFKGGKGVATLLGLSLGTIHNVALVSLLVFIIVFILTRYVSLGSLTAGATFLLIVLLKYNHSISLTIFSITAFILLIITHRKNIQRLLNGTENKIVFKKNRDTN